MFNSNVKNLLKYSYNRYLPTHDITILSDTVLSDINLNETDYSNTVNYRMWSFEKSGDYVASRFYYQFEGTDGTPAVLLMQPSLNLLTDTINNIASINSQKCAILDKQGNLLFAPASLTDEDISILSNPSNITEGYKILEDNNVYFCVSCDALPITFVSTQKIGTSLHLNHSIIPSLIFCGVLILACILISYLLLVRGISSRIVKLSNYCESLALSKLTINKTPSEELPDILSFPAISNMGNDEIGTLSNSINNMLGRITELSRLHAEEVQASQRVAYDMLAAQIHPHFIYNTIENLRMLAELHEDPEVADQLYALGRMMRLNISDSSSTGEISMELEHAEMYMQLQKMRLNERLEYKIEPVDDKILHTKCPRFLLQPLVENAIKHGFQDSLVKETITISSEMRDGFILIHVFNDGLTIPEDRLEAIHEALQKNQPITNTKGGIGLINVNTRLRYFFGKEAGLIVESNAGHGTVCTLKMPLEN